MVDLASVMEELEILTQLHLDSKQPLELLQQLDHQSLVAEDPSEDFDLVNTKQYFHKFQDLLSCIVDVCDQQVSIFD